MTRRTETAVACDGARDFTQLLACRRVAVQHAERLSVVRTHANVQGAAAVFVDDSRHLKPGDFERHYPVLYHDVDARCCERFRALEVLAARRDYCRVGGWCHSAVHAVCIMRAKHVNREVEVCRSTRCDSRTSLVVRIDDDHTRR